MLIDHNASGSTALTADRSHIGLQIDMDSSATGGDISNEHRLYGIHNNVKATGDSDLVYGVYSIAGAEQTAGQVSILYGVFGQATTDAIAGTISNSYGVYGYNSLTASSGTTISNAFAVYGKALVGAAQDANVSQVLVFTLRSKLMLLRVGTTVSVFMGSGQKLTMMLALLTQPSPIAFCFTVTMLATSPHQLTASTFPIMSGTILAAILLLVTVKY